ncbi:DUF6292 family protein [Amycolatopsis sp.]|uniref:DUF6292 family protein n=1 Tax=Amycolatopsis sp. TaxID=37632 RepID=UPI002CA64FE4|nr:DUF6292 family protein [Amycolatopsis sp.]HVV14569.1 DUF6292 family protein [Amycolatopsis sp.]
MKPDQNFAPPSDMRRYIESVATALGVEPAASLTEYGNPSHAYIALADTSNRYPGRLLMLLWNSETGWSLALEPERSEAHRILASWPGVVSPAPARVAELVQRTLAGPAAPGAVPSPSAAAASRR